MGFRLRKAGGFAVALLVVLLPLHLMPSAQFISYASNSTMPTDLGSLLSSYYKSRTRIIPFNNTLKLIIELKKCSDSDVQSVLNEVSIYIKKLINNQNSNYIIINKKIKEIGISIIKSHNYYSNCNPSLLYKVLIITLLGEITPNGVLISEMESLTNNITDAPSLYYSALLKLLPILSNDKLSNALKQLLYEVYFRSPRTFLALVALSYGPIPSFNLNLTRDESLDIIGLVRKTSFYDLVNYYNLTSMIKSPYFIIKLYYRETGLLDKVTSIALLRYYYPNLFLAWLTLNNKDYLVEENTSIGSLDLSNLIVFLSTISLNKNYLKSIMNDSGNLSEMLRATLGYPLRKFTSNLVYNPSDYNQWILTSGLANTLLLEGIRSHSKPILALSLKLVMDLESANPFSPIDAYRLTLSLENNGTLIINKNLIKLLKMGKYKAFTRDAEILIDKRSESGKQIYQMSALYIAAKLSQNTTLQGIPRVTTNTSELPSLMLEKAVKYTIENKTEKAAEIIQELSSTIYEGEYAINTAELRANQMIVTIIALEHEASNKTLASLKKLYQDLYNITQLSIGNRLGQNTGGLLRPEMAEEIAIVLHNTGEENISNLLRLYSIIAGSNSSSIYYRYVESDLMSTIYPELVRLAANNSTIAKMLNLSHNYKLNYNLSIYSVTGIAKLLNQIALSQGINNKTINQLTQIMNRFNSTMQREILQNLQGMNPFLAKMLKMRLGFTSSEKPSLKQPRLKKPNVGSPNLKIGENGSIVGKESLVALTVIVASILIAFNFKRIAFWRLSKRLERKLAKVSAESPKQVEPNDIVAMYEIMLSILARLRRPKLPSETHREYDRALGELEHEIHSVAMKIYEKAKFSREKPTPEEVATMKNLASRLLEIAQKRPGRIK